MAVALSMRIPGLTPERYDRMIAELELDANPPAGMILHVVCESVGSTSVWEVWQTSAAAENFVGQRIRPALERLRVKEPLAYRIEPLHNLYAPEMDMVERIGVHSVPRAA